MSTSGYNHLAGQDVRPLAASIAVLALDLLLIAPSVVAIGSHFRHIKPRQKLYEDEDGIASEESMAAYSAKIPKIILAISTIAGFVIATAGAVLTTLNRNEGLTIVQNWLIVAQWAVVLIQTVSISIVKEPPRPYFLGLYSGFSSLFLFMVLLFQVTLLVQSGSSGDGSWKNPTHIFIYSSQLVASIISALASVSIPRRPEVFYDNHPVDSMYTDSALGRLSFAWIEPMLMLAKRRKHLDLKNLPKMDHRTRAQDLSQSWTNKQHPRRLWIELVLAHKRALATQWGLTLLQAVGTFAPQFVTYFLLRILENRVYGEKAPAEAWIWVIILTLTSVGVSWIESWMFWISWSELAIPVRAQLSALIFQKAMRRKDVKGASKDAIKGNVANADEIENAASEDEDEEESDPKSKQSTVNLIGVDTKRVSEFCSFNNLFPGSIFELFVSFVFLWSIIGWESLLAGFLAMACTIPINIWSSKRYSDAQDRLMKARDAKMAVVTEALQGIRQIKFSALETNWHQKIGKFRAKELDEQWSVFLADTFLLFCWISSPILLSAASLACYAVIHGSLTPSIAFTAIAIFANLEVTLSVIPELTTDLIDAYISISRIERYLNSPEISKNNIDTSTSISFENASIAWPSDEKKEADDQRYVLRNLNLSFPEKELSVISGKTGTGKSLLLAAILGEVDVLSGKISVPRSPNTQERRDHLATRDNWILPNSIAFVAQIPWIENASIKDNILFGLPFDEQRYKKVIEVCALRKDLDMLTDGENTEIGANGINLSGGQRWRVTFARALYSRAGILILDDIFSAVDAHVGRFLFEKALTGELGAGRTRILVTHHVALVKSKTKYVVELGDGTVENAGLVDDLQAGTLDTIVSHQETEDEIQEDEDPTAVNSEESSDSETMEQLKKVNSKQAPKKFVEEEAREHGRVKGAVYKAYLKAGGGVPYWIVVLLAFAGMQAIVTGRSWWLKIWTGNDGHEAKGQTFTHFLQSQTPSPGFYNASLSNPILHSESNSGYSLKFYLGIYIMLSVVSALLGTFQYFYLYTGSLRASRVLFNNLCYTVLRTPLRWIDTVPLGRILNRFTSDFETVDGRLSRDFSGELHDIFQLTGVIVAGIFVSPYVILLAACLLSACVWIASIYLHGAREVKRLESNAKSPIFEQFGSALTGVGTIRAFSKTDTYIERMFRKLDDYSTTYWHLWAFNRWMGLRMALVGSLFATIVASIILIIPTVDASLAGFALSFALNYGQTVIWIIRHYANLELQMNAVERIAEYSDLPTESQDGADPPAAWPSEGRLEVNDLVVSYAPDLPPVLKGVTFRVERSERIGVVGRTGAGKSSLTLAVFRFLEARQGSIHIDGLDISKIKLHSLRSRLAIIPQDPVLFSGTIKSNLDAFDEHSDSELRDALVRVHLVTATELSSSTNEASGSSAPSETENQNINPFTSLNSPVSEGGLNLSQGQRQLLCLARAIVSRPKIVVLDEATSAVDMATDALIQRSIREEFGDSTLLVIAHRLSTISDFDKILVMDDGKVAEFGTPRELMQITNGIFRGMVGESGEKEKLEKLIMG
ncbi:ABC bile acid transporter, putative [Talaromyces stipitatus ATCC 10500]|uniref:ABC bile acid transporter, putative n=1 Tax=Talaromyces stipitatus (strain ATCC 10500 / CBS 375.48 / QM 6759 / NRRL 1006) TaxID=441959 RepID=B8LTC7_TALSN|nr:ABC bile acid transporter, putative [Talaromyces stipitatus ATCC 10500]EED23005.1 ABC bile acid transporter, putative [Talaromyces stipitatus ATCC 10500]